MPEHEHRTPAPWTSKRRWRHAWKEAWFAIAVGLLGVALWLGIVALTDWVWDTFDVAPDWFVLVQLAGFVGAVVLMFVGAIGALHLLFKDTPVEDRLAKIRAHWQ